MSVKNLDCKKRWRNVTIAFRMSEEESNALNNKVKLYGKRTKQEYIISALLEHKVVAVGNPLMFLQFRKILNNIDEFLKQGKSIDDETRVYLQEMNKILEAFEKKESGFDG